MNNKQVERSLERDKLSDYLPYLAYDDKTHEFINTDNSFGYMYECSSLYFMGDKTIDTLESIIKQDYGENAILQFIMFADTNITEHCEDVAVGDKRKTPLTKKMNQYHADFLSNSKNYANKLKDNKLKNYRLFVCLKTKKSLTETVVTAFKESLAGAGLNPIEFDVKNLLALLRQLLNGDDGANKQNNYDNSKSISPQAIFADTKITFGSNSQIRIGNEFVSVLTPKEFPGYENDQTLNVLQVNELIGSYQGGINDLEQISSRFIWSCNILLDKIDGKLRRKYDLANLQRAGAKMSNNISDRITTLSLAVKNLSADHYLRFIPSLVIFASSEHDISVSTTRARRLWESQGFVMQKEDYIKHIMFLASLPFGLYPGKKEKNIKTLDRHFIASSKAIANQLPVQGDFKGYGHPIVPFVGRKAQVQGLDLFAKGSSNYNFLCCAKSGSGKSFFANFLLSHYFAYGVKIRINDIGGSYKKMAKLFNGMYIDIADKNINLNPFQSPKDLNKKYAELDKEGYDEIDKEHDIETITMILGEMVYSNTSDGKLTAEETGLLTHAVKHVIANGDIENSIDHVQEYLANLGKYSTEGSIPKTLHDRAKELSFNFCPFSSKGEYGYLFNGVSENTWQDNPFVVLELESLSAKPALMKVVSLQIINMMTQEMYQGDRSEKKMSVFDEVAFMFGSSQRLAKVVEDGYRRARKYNGSFGTIFQSILDTRLFGRVGEVMNNNAAFKFYLESSDYEKAIEEKLITLDEFTAKLLTSVKSNRPHYSEVFMDTPAGVGISRLMVGPYGYAIATTDADEVVEIENYQKEGLPIDQALKKFAKKRGLVVNDT